MKRFPKAQVLCAGLVACSLSFGTVAPAGAATPPANQGSSLDKLSDMSSEKKGQKGAEGSSPEKMFSGLSSDKDKAGKGKKKPAKNTTKKDPADFEQLSGTVGLNSLQEWYNGSNEVGKTILKVLGVIAALEILGMLLGPIRSFLFNAVGVR
ncbi:hypothetical protein C1Y63_02980 [Corynebacterium sp. 13CS0277]|uniref:hypothetical protein n=1 Tax=Corynebacterium sp. 13CS0277 TaxID=2071994 RepID=UPI000D042336|nr:hypothetical protein [Corynebacterium sp. 13CS0277]PRQ12050.1 hypothetical protein C1Y63_02980 [Corynebacterium sp. 13CS0277]